VEIESELEKYFRRLEASWKESRAGFLVHKNLNKFQELSKETRLGELDHVYLCFWIITWIIAWLCMLFVVYYFWILCFWKTPRNCLADD